ncbi:MAG: formate--tetrahydrofolate ligase [bacterium]|nr:formate--tetrahydrofolate ligase [bacterium]
MQSDLAIAQAAPLRPIAEIAQQYGVLADELIPFGHTMAKVRLSMLARLQARPNGKYIDVTGITPTPLGEGKTVTTIGLTLGLNKLGAKAITCIRQPSLGPVFGIKGGAAGGGFSQVVPMEDFNLHLTGDNHAVSIAHNLLAAFIDNHLHHGNAIGIDPRRIMWRHVVDVSDRALRNVVIGLGTRDDGIPRQSGFDITVASECMAILALARDLKDLRARLGRIIVAVTNDNRPVTAEDLRCAGAMAVLLKEALLPNIMQTLEHTLCFVHAGPFANIAHGNSSILADQMALKLGDYVVTESGFGADCGMEKFMHIKCRASGMQPDAVCLVASVRALKMHSGDFRVVAGKPLDKGLLSEDLDALRRGMPNLIKHIENVQAFGVPVVVAINRFPSDSEREHALIQECAMAAGADDAVVSDVHARGGEGGTALARAIMKAAAKPSAFKLLYELEQPIEQKIEAVARGIYGAHGVSFSAEARKQITWLNQYGFGNLPVCIAKTHLSLSHDPNLKGRPTGFTVPVKDVRVSAGAGFIYALTGDIRTMPGLPSVPAGCHVDLDEHGNVVGLF